MAGDLEDDDPLLRAIAELRTEVNQLIDEQVSYVKDRVEEQPVHRPFRLAPVSTATEPSAEPAKVRTLDPRERLDALAKHLDHRLRQASLPAAERSDRSAPVEE
jgi:hypothetical protein